MKVLLKINGESYLIPKSPDLNKILDLFQGVTRVKTETEYGPDGARYKSDLYMSSNVLESRPEQITLSLVHDDEVITQSEWGEKLVAHGNACAAWQEKNRPLKKDVAACYLPMAVTQSLSVRD